METTSPFRVTARWRLFSVAIAIVGGLAGLVGSFAQEMLRGGLLGPWVAGPIIEESLKPAGVYALLFKWPHLLTSRLYTAFLAALGGLTFGAVENIIYLYIYFPQHSHAMVLIRWTTGMFLHTFCSFIVGLGLDSSLVAGVRGDIPLFSKNKRYFIIAMAIHSAYNIAATVFNGYLRSLD